MQPLLRETTALNTAESKKKSFFSLTSAGALVLLLLLILWHGLDILASVRECRDSFLIPNYCMLAAGLTAVCILSIYLIGTGRLSLHLSIGIIVLLLGLANICVFKGLSAPDEVSHYISAYKLSNRMLGKAVCDEHGRVYVRAGDLYLEDTGGNLEEVMLAAENGEASELKLNIFGQTLDESVYRVYAEGSTGDKRSMDETGISCQYTVNTTPLAYLPQAIGISLARLMGLSSLWLITLGKLFNLLFYTGMVTLAISIIPKAKKLMAGTALLPMCLHLAGSMSYDVFVLSCAFVYTALIVSMKEHGISRARLIAAAVIIGILAPCKLIYSLLLIAVVSLVPAKEAGQHERRAFAALVIFSVILAAASMYAVNAGTIGSYASADERVISWAEEAQGYTVSYLLHRPFELMGICYRSVMMKTGFWFSTMFGIYLGNMDPVLNVPYPVIGLYAAGLLIIAAGSELRLPAFSKGVYAFTFAAVAAALMGSMLIAYTPMSSVYIEGVQGRYLLPVLPLLLMCIPGDWISLREGTDRQILILFIIAECFVLIRVFATVALRIG